jgi:hypothetical protein
MLFGRFDLMCHFHEGARLLKGEVPLLILAAKSFYRAAFLLRTSAA